MDKSVQNYSKSAEYANKNQRINIINNVYEGALQFCGEARQFEGYIFLALQLAFLKKSIESTSLNPQ